MVGVKRLKKMLNIKVVVVGDGSVGKTSLLNAYVDKTFSTEYVPTVFDNRQTSILVDNKEYSLGIWDTAGQEGFDRLRPLSYPESDIFLLCFDISNEKTFKALFSRWLPELEHHQPDTPCIVVGTKADLRNNPKFMEESKARTSAEYESEALAAGALGYEECSAKEMMNLDNVFEVAVKKAVEDKKQRTERAKELQHSRSTKMAGSGVCCTLM